MVNWDNAPEGAEYWGRTEIWTFDTYFKFAGEALYWYRNDKWELFNDAKYYKYSLSAVAGMVARPVPVIQGKALVAPKTTVTSSLHMYDADDVPASVQRAINLTKDLLALSDMELSVVREMPEAKALLELLRAPTPTTQNKYDREIIGKYGTGKCTVDVYRVLNAFGPLPPETQHAIKKLLAPGKRGAKDEKQDLLEAIQSIEARLQYLEACDA